MLRDANNVLLVTTKIMKDKNIHRKSGYNTYRGWTEIDRQDRHWNTDQKEDGTLDDRRRDGRTNSTLRTKEQGKHITLNEHDDDDVHIKTLKKAPTCFDIIQIIFRVLIYSLLKSLILKFVKNVKSQCGDAAA